MLSMEYTNSLLQKTINFSETIPFSCTQTNNLDSLTFQFIHNHIVHPFYPNKYTHFRKFLEKNIIGEIDLTIPNPR